MNIDFLVEYAVPVVVGICLCVGYILKHWVKDADNKVIPTVCAILGVAVAMWIHWPELSAEIVLEGLASGLAATGLHQAVKQLTKEDENAD